MDATVSIGTVLLLFLAFLIFLFIIYTKFGKRGPDLRTSNFSIDGVEDPRQKSLGMVNVTGTTVGGYTRDAVVVSIPLEVFAQSDYSINQLFARITEVKPGSNTDSDVVETDSTIDGNIVDADDSEGIQNNSDMIVDNQETTLKEAMDEKSAVVIEDINAVEEDDRVLNPESDLEDLQKLVAAADLESTDDEEYEIITDL